MLSELVLPIVCNKYNITCILFDENYKVIEYSKNIQSIISDKSELKLQEDIRTYFWEFIGLESEFEDIYALKKDSLNIPMVFKNDNYYDIDIELCEIQSGKKMFLAMFTKETKFAANYSSMLQKINHETLIFEEKKKNMETNEHYYNLINKNIISFHVDSDGMITEVNEACLLFFGFSNNKMIGHHFSTFFITRESNIALSNNETVILRAVDVNGIDVFFHSNIIPIKGNQTICENIIICQDITHLKRVESELEYAVNHDSLTGLPNRTLLLKRVDELLEKSKNEEISFALCFIDLDKFKSVNDNIGHHAGDMLLKYTGEVLKKVVRDCDTVARIGGDEFIILFENLGHKEFLPSTLKRIENLKKDEPLYYQRGTIIPLTFSLGLSIYPNHGLDIKSLLEHADKEMYTSKKNRV